MERMNVNPTRMMLTQLKRRLKAASRGHKLMKDKRDELMKEFLDQARENGRLREEVERKLENVYFNFTRATAVISQEAMEEALMFPKQGVKLEVGSKNIMSVDVPEFSFTTTATDAADIYPYGFARTTGELDNAISYLADIFPMMLDLAAKEKQTALLAAELEKTRRRVNALEYVMIPRLQVTIRYIQMKLDENERGNQTRLMKVKDMMLEENITEKQEKKEEALRQRCEEVAEEAAPVKTKKSKAKKSEPKKSETKPKKEEPKPKKDERKDDELILDANNPATFLSS